MMGSNTHLCNFMNSKLDHAKEIHTYLFFLQFLSYFIVVQLPLSAFSPHLSTPPQPNPPPSPASTLPLDFGHVSFIVVPENPSPHCPFPSFSFFLVFSFLFIYFCYFIVVQLQLSAFSPHPSTPPQPNPPPSPASTLPLGFVVVSFIVVPENLLPTIPSRLPSGYC